MLAHAGDDMASEWDTGGAVCGAFDAVYCGE